MNEFINYNEFIDYIATELSFNYMTVSFGETHKDGFVIAGIDNEKEICENVFEPIFNQYISEVRGFEKCRNILVIGSGATHDAYSALPLGVNSKFILNKHLNIDTLLRTHEGFRNKFNEEARRILTIKKRFPPDTDKDLIYDDDLDFESYLLLLTKFFREQEIRDAIHSLFNLRYAPSLLYEIIAHSFKHGFWDVIINFNFDELLDQAIKEEMGVSNYFTIISDGDCRDIAEIVIDGRLKIPLYIKPHGTISHKSTLRFTKDHYLDLPDGIKSLLWQIFRGQLQNDQTAPSLTKVNVLTVGFNLESVEFNDILQTVQPRPRIFSIVYDEPPKLFCKEGMEASCSSENGCKNVILLSQLNGTEESITPLTNIFLNIFNSICSKFNELYAPRTITRHLLYHDIFYKAKYSKVNLNKITNEKEPHVDIQTLNNTFNKSDFFRDRAIIELAISLARGRGKIELKELMKDRLGKVYTNYRKFHEQDSKFSLPSSLYDLADIFYLKEEFSFSRNVHNISDLEKGEILRNSKIAKLLWNDNEIERFTIEKNSKNFGKLIVFRILYSSKTPESIKLLFRIGERKEKWNQELIQKTCEGFEKIHFSGHYHDINPRFYDPRLYIFDHFYKDQILHSNLSYAYRFNEVFFRPDKWDILLHVSDTGLRLNELIEHMHKQNGYDWDKMTNKIYLISCLESIKQKYGFFESIKELIKSHKNIFPGYFSKNLIHKTLPYSDHNHHISIFLKKIVSKEPYPLSQYPTIQITNAKGNTDNYIFVRSIYFYKKGFSNKINPLWIRGAFAFLNDEKSHPPNNFGTNLLVKDHLMLLETFYAYHRKATSFEDTNGRYLEYLLPKDMKDGNPPTNRRFDLKKLFHFITKQPKADY